jgi:hypothetical protein
VQTNPGGKVQLVITEILGNLLIPLISKNPNDILAWNWKIKLHPNMENMITLAIDIVVLNHLYDWP